MRSAAMGPSTDHDGRHDLREKELDAENTSNLESDSTNDHATFEEVTT